MKTKKFLSGKKKLFKEPKHKSETRPLKGMIRPIVGAAAGIMVLGATASVVKSMQK